MYFETFGVIFIEPQTFSILTSISLQIKFIKFKNLRSITKL